MNINKLKKEIFTTFISNNEYQADPRDDDYAILTTVRYTNNKVSEAFVCDYSGKHIFKIAISEANISDLSEKELKSLEEHIKYSKEFENADN